MKDKERMFQMGHVGSEQRLRDENVDSGLRSESIRESNQEHFILCGEDIGL